MKLKETAERYTGRKVTQVVLAIPVEFNAEQRAATERAGKLAGLDVLRYLNLFRIANEIGLFTSLLQLPWRESLK